MEKENIKLSFGAMTASSARSASVLSKNSVQDTLRYTDAFGVNTRVEYTPTDYGFKEEIILDSYSGKNEFTFVVNTYGLTPVAHENGVVYFLDSRDSPVGLLEPVFAYDATGMGNATFDNTVSVTHKNGNLYSLTYSIDETFLADATTVYPVTIDPSFPMDFADDSSVYSGNPSTNYQAATVGYVGYDYGGNGIARLYHHVDLSAIDHIYPEEIMTADLYMHELTGGTSSDYINVHKVTSSWNASSITYNNQPSYSSTVAASFALINPSGDYWYTARITDVVKQWLDSPSSNHGVALKSQTNTTSIWKAFSKSNYFQAALRPYLKVVTRTRIVTNWGVLDAGDARGAVISGDNRVVTFTVQTQGEYYIEATEPNEPDNDDERDTCLYLCNSSGNEIGYSDDIGNGNYYSRINTTLSPGTYSVRLTEYNGAYDNIANVEAFLAIWRKGALIWLEDAVGKNFCQNYANTATDFIKIGDGYDPAVDDYNQNCLGYALFPDSETLIWPYGTATPDVCQELLASYGYTPTSSVTDNCIVEYIRNGVIVHYALIKNGIVTSKWGTKEIMQHSSADCFYDSSFKYAYGSIYRYYIKTE